MAHLDDIARAVARPRRLLMALASVLLLGQWLAVAHALDTQAHADERACELCHVANELAGAAASVDDTPIPTPTALQPVVVIVAPGHARDTFLRPPTRAPPAHLATP